MKEIETVKAGEETAFTLSEDGTLLFKGRLCIPEDADMKKQILDEAHSTPYSV